jgi:hypothetical protein
MLSYSQIVKTSYQITVQNPLLWLFGLFVVGGFNLNFLYFQDIPFKEAQNQISLPELLQFFQSHPGMLAALSASVFLVSVLLLVLTNWCRIVLVLSTRSIMEKGKPEIAGQVRKSPKFLWRVIKISLLTSALMFVVSAGLLGTPFWLVKNPVYQAQLWTIGVVFLIPLAFTISSVNIFTTFFAVVFNQNVRKALNLGTDLFVTHWAKILGLSAVLMVIYSACFAGGVSIIYLARVVFRLILSLSDTLGIFHFSAMIIAAQVLTGVFLWVLLSGLNVFFNTALLLLFLQLTTPIEGDKVKDEEILPIPASSSI